MAHIVGPEQVPRTRLEEAKRELDARSAIFVDVRPREEYEQSHIPGALSIPLHGAAERYFTLPRDRDVILY